LVNAVLVSSAIAPAVLKMAIKPRSTSGLLMNIIQYSGS